MIVEAEGIVMFVVGGADGTEIAHSFDAFIWSTKFFVFRVNFFSLSLFLRFLEVLVQEEHNSTEDEDF